MPFNLNCTMHLKQFHNIATKVSSIKSATTFGDLPDWLCSQFWMWSFFSRAARESDRHADTDNGIFLLVSKC